MKRLLVLLAVAALVGATLTALLGSARWAWAQERGAPGSGELGENVAATVDGEPITWDEVDSEIAMALYQLEQQARELRMQRLQMIVERRLLQKEADGRGVSVQELLRSEVDSKIEEVAEEDVNSLLGDQGLERTEQNVERARDYLRSLAARRRYGEFLDSLDVGGRVAISPLPIPEQPTVEVSVSGAQMRGRADAPVTIIEFGDFGCGYCRRSAPVLKRLLDTYGDKLRLVYRHFPLGERTRGRRAAEASECAGVQGRFWEYHDLLYEEAGEMDDAGLKAYATKVALDEKAFAACLEAGEFAEKVQEDREAGARAGVNATPTFFVNGRYVRGAQPYEAFKQFIDEELGRLGLL